MSAFLVVTNQPSYAQTLSDVLVGGDSKPGSAETTTVEKISAEVNSASDTEIQARLEGIFSELEQYSGISVFVSNSVVTLAGSLLSAAAITDAESLASKVEGVVQVDNKLIVTTAVSERLDNSIDELTQDSRLFLSNLPILTLAIAVIVAGWFLGRYVSKIRPLFLRIAPNLFIAELFGTIAWIIIFVIGLYIGLRLIDATELIGTVLGAAGIVGLAVGFAVRDTVENYIASILLSIRHPFKTKDYVAIGDIEGSVARLTSRATILVSAEGNHIRIPNSIVYKSIITNYSRNPLRRFEFTIGIDSSDDILFVQKLALPIISGVSGVVDEPACSITVDKLGDSNTTLLIRGWVNQSLNDLVKVRSETIRQLKLGLDSANIIMPEPIYQLKIATSSLSSFVDSAAASSKPAPTEKSQLGSIKTNSRTADTNSPPAQSVKAENIVSKAIDTEIEISDENLLSDYTAQE